MKKNYTEEYVELLEETLALIGQKQAYMQKLLTKKEGDDRAADIRNINKLDEIIAHKRRGLEELKKLRKI